VPDLARFLRALHRIPINQATRAWAPPDDFARTDIQRHAPKAKQRLIANLAGLADADIQLLIARLEALVVSYMPPGVSCWVHGDLYACHLVLNPAGGLAGVIDWGDVHIGDPAPDLSIAWSFLPAAARRMFRDVCHLLSRKHDSLRLTQQPVTHDTVIRDTWLRWTRLAG
jgi:aminoglycoside phosphotransferase (APT) family kinase protein